MCIFVGTALGTGVAISSAMVAADLAIIGSIAAAGFQIAANNAQAEAAEKAADYEAQVAEYEAVLEQQSGNVEQVRLGINARREFGKMLNERAAQGSDLAFGNPADLATEVRGFQAFDSDNLARTTAARVLGLQLRAEGIRTEADNVKTAVMFGNVGVGFSAVASIGGTVSDMYSRGFLGSSSPKTSNAIRYGGGSSSAGRLTAGSVGSRAGAGGFFSLGEN